MKVTFLGTNGWYDTKTGNTTCVFIETKSAFIILDAGNGIHKIGRYIKNSKKPIYLFLSHFHLDHIIGFHVMNKFCFHQGIDVYGPAGLRMLFKSVMNKPYTIPISRLKTKIRLHEIYNSSLLPPGVECRPLKHSIFCYGYRFSLENKTVSYCTDTGVCKNLYFLAKESDLFITECSFKSGQVNKEWPHLNPESAAKVAAEAGVKRLALIHFDASLYSNLKERFEAEKISRRTFGNSFVSRDNMEIKL